MSRQRILVIGSGGSGKSTLANTIGQLLNLTVVHLDSCYWQAGWVATPIEQWQPIVERICETDTWVMDGNYSGTLDRRLKYCDTIIFLDMPRLLCLWQICKRWLTYRGKTRPDMAAGCPEHLTWEFISWVWTYPKRRRAKILQTIATCAEKQVIVLKSPAAISNFVEQLAGQRDLATRGDR